MSRLDPYWRALRPDESLMMLGVPLLGILFARPLLSWDLLLRSGVLLFCGLLVVGHLYTLNDLLGLSYDIRDRNKAGRPLMARQVDVLSMIVFCVVLGGLGYWLLWRLDPGLVGLGFSLSGLWMLYSLPRGLKGVPIVTSLLNGIGAGILPFLIGYRFAAGDATLGVWSSLYFGLIAAAGQMNREILDREADAAAGLITTAVWLGRKFTFRSSFLLFVVSAVYLGVLSLVMDRTLMGLGLAALCIQPLHWLAYRRCLAAGLDHRDAMTVYIRGYRRIYLGLGLAFSLLLGWRLLI